MKKTLSSGIVLMIVIGTFLGMAHSLNTVDASGPEPCNGGSDTAYLHIEVSDSGGSTQWFNALEDDPESDDYYETDFLYPMSTWWTFGAPIREGPDDVSELDEPLYLKEDGRITGQYKVSFELGTGADYPDEIIVSLWIDGERQASQSYMHQATNIYQYDFNYTDTAADSEVAMRIQFHLSSGSTTATIYSDGSSYFVLPLFHDTDSDGIEDEFDSDDDNDGMPDTWEETYGLNSKDASDANNDPDNDDLNNADEYNNGTNPTNPDTDGDGYNDGYEVSWNSDPTDAQSVPSVSEDGEDEDKGFLEQNLVAMVGLFILVLIIIIIILIVAVRRRG